jgi:2-hydroxy-6-oxonona-2,4-dienedioate hydrolase
MTTATRFRRLRAALGGLLAAAAGIGCSPPDRHPTRPEAVPATPYEQRDAVVDGLRLRYIDVGPYEDGDGSTVLLIHGHTSRIEEYDGLVPILARRRRVLVPDLPGSGYSDKPEREYTLAFYEDTLVHFLDGLGVERAHLAGGSQGGNLVLRLAHRFPSRFDRLAPWAPGSAWEARPWVAAAIRALNSYVIFWPMVKIQSRYWYSDDWPNKDETLRNTFTYYDEVMCPGFVDMYFGMAADQVGRTLFDLAPQIRQPVLLAWGDRDHGANMGEGVKRLHELLPHSELLVFKGARHSLAAEVPEPLAGAIAAFLDRPEAELPGTDRVIRPSSH